MAIDRLQKKIGVGRHSSAIKRARQSEKRRARNKHEMSTMKSAVKKVRTSKSKDALKEAIPLITKAAKNGIIHRNKASRLVSRLTKTVGA